jgi:hypothetical protein
VPNSGEAVQRCANQARSSVDSHTHTFFATHGTGRSLGIFAELSRPTLPVWFRRVLQHYDQYVEHLLFPALDLF